MRTRTRVRTVLVADLRRLPKSSPEKGLRAARVVVGPLSVRLPFGCVYGTARQVSQPQRAIRCDTREVVGVCWENPVHGTEGQRVG